MPSGKRFQLPESFVTVWIIVRVGLILLVWLSIFLALFLGYFTVPIAVVAVFSAIYALTDATLLVTSQMQTRAQRRRAEMIKARQLPDEDDDTAAG